MTASNELKRLINVADEAFEAPASDDEVETGFEPPLVDETIQVRRACRYLRLARILQGHEYNFMEHQRNYAAAIELSFQVIERTCQAELIAADVYEEGQSHSDHARTIRDSAKTALWDDAEAQALADLYKSARVKTYYADGVPSRTRANAMVELATEVHRHAVQTGRLDATQCLCDGS